MADKGKETVWDQLKGVKEELTETIEFEMGEVDVELAVKYLESETILEINQEYDEKKPAKPKKKVPGIGKIEVPSEKYAKFNDCKEAKEWEEEVEPIERERKYRLAYEFLADEYKPSDDPKEGIEILQERLRTIDVAKIVNAGLKLSGFLNNNKEQNKDS